MSNPYEIRVYRDSRLYINQRVLKHEYIHRGSKFKFRLHTPMGLITADDRIDIKHPGNYYEVFIAQNCWVISSCYGRETNIIPPSLFSGILTDITPSGLRQINLSMPLFQLLQKIGIKSLLPCWINNSICSHTILLAWINYCKGQGYKFDSHSSAWSSFILHYNRDNYPHILDLDLEFFPGKLPRISLNKILEDWQDLPNSMEATKNYTLSSGESIIRVVQKFKE